MKNWKIQNTIIFILIIAMFGGVFCVFNIQNNSSVTFAEDSLTDTVATTEATYDTINYVSLGDSIAEGYRITKDGGDVNIYGLDKAYDDGENGSAYNGSDRKTTFIRPNTYTDRFANYLSTTTGRQTNVTSFAKSGSNTADICALLGLTEANQITSGSTTYKNFSDWYKFVNDNWNESNMCLNKTISTTIDGVQGDYFIDYNGSETTIHKGHQKTPYTESAYETIASADIITLSIGANDILTYPISGQGLSDLAGYLYPVLEDVGILEKGGQDRIYGHLKEGIVRSQHNYPLLLKKITQINPNAQIFIFTVFNPFKELTNASNDVWLDHTLFDYVPLLKARLQLLGQETDQYVGRLNEIISNSIFDLDNKNVHIVDVNQKFDDYLSSTNKYTIVNCTLLKDGKWDQNTEAGKPKITTNTENLNGQISMADAADVHPSVEGHLLIFNSIKSVFEKECFILESIYGEDNPIQYKNSDVIYASEMCMRTRNTSYQSTGTVNKLKKSDLPTLTKSVNNELFINWYKNKNLEDSYNIWDFLVDKISLHTKIYAKWGKLELVSGDEKQHVSNLIDAGWKFHINADEQAKWYVNENCVLEGQNNFYFYPNSYGTYRIYCKVNNIKSQVYEIKCFYKPNKLADEDVLITGGEVSNGVINNTFTLNINNINSSNMDLSQIVWLKDGEVVGENCLSITLPNITEEHEITIKYGEDEIYSEIIKPLFYVKFDTGESNDATEDQYIEYGGYASEPTTIPQPLEEDSLFAGWYYYDELDNKQECLFDQLAITKDITIYASYTKLTSNLSDIENNFYSSNINDFGTIKFEIQAYSHVQDLWYVGNTQIDSSSIKEGSNNSISFEFKPTEFGAYHIYCSLAGEEFEGYIINYYQVPTEVSISKSRLSLNSYNLQLSHNADQQYLDATKIKWYRINPTTQDKIEIGNGELSTIVNIDSPYKFLVEYDDGTFNRQYETEIINPYYIVSFYIGNEKITKQEVELGSVASDIVIKQKDNCLLKGWYEDNNFAQSKKWGFDTLVDKDLNLYAKWVEMEYKSNENLLVQYLKDVHEVNFAIDLDEEVVWIVEYNGEIIQQTSKLKTFNFTPNYNVIGTYKIYCKLDNYNSNYEEISVVYYVPSSLTISNEEIDINTYTFKVINDESIENTNEEKIQWYKNVDGVEYPIHLNDEPLKGILNKNVEVTDYCLVYAKYDDGITQLVSNEIRITPYYLVKFISNEQVIYFEYVLRDNSVEDIPTVDRHNYIFGGWYKDNNYQNIFYNESPILSNASIYAKWAQVEFDNPLLETQYINGVQSTNFILDIQGTAYWYVNGIYYGSTSSSLQNPKNEFTFTPTLGVVATYSIRCEINGKNSNTQFVNVQYYNPETLEVQKTEIVRNNIEISIADENAMNLNPLLFDWYIVDSLGVVTKLDDSYNDISMMEYKVGLTIELTEPCEIYLTYNNNEVERFSLSPKYDVIFITHIGTPIIVPIEKYQLVTPEPITRKGYIFGGWYTDSKYLNPFNFNTQITEDIALYAKWANLQCKNEELLVQYESDISPVEFYIDIKDINITWYVNNSLQLTHTSSNVFTYTPQTYGKYDVCCELYEEKSNIISIMVYQIPTELEISKTKNTDNTYTFKVNNLNVNNVNQENFVWMKSTKEGDVQIGQGANLSTGFEEDCDIYLVYINEDTQVISNTLNILKETPKNNNADTIIILISIITGVVLCAGILFIYFKYFNNKKPPQSPIEDIKEKPLEENVKKSVSKPSGAKTTKSTTTKKTSSVKKSNSNQSSKTARGNKLKK